MSTQKGRNVRLEVAATYAAAKTVSAITKASPGVATSTAHALADGTIGYFTGLSGMTELEDQVASVDTPVSNAFNIEGLDTTNFGTFASTCLFTPVATWATLSEATKYSLGGGDADQLDKTTLLDTSKKIEFGLNAAETVSIEQFSNPSAAAAILLEAAARAGTDVVFRITLNNGERRVFRGQPSLPGEEMGVNALATGSFSVAIKGRIMKLPA